MIANFIILAAFININHATQIHTETKPLLRCNSYLMVGIDEPSERGFIFMKLIPLTTTKEVKYFAQVDDEDFDFLMQWKWCARNPKRDLFYAVRSRKDENGKSLKQVRMHREIMGLSDENLQVDHIDHNGLNNQRSNLRIVTHTQNNFNRRPTRGNSKYIGVSFFANRWAASISKGGENFYLGRFKDEVEAAKARDKKAKELFGEHAYLNFPIL